ncbi:MAG TPA: hypothetical protein VNL37_05240 [Candidatus Polarisedimenticolia bacterium]|nr:hypothetical protein [Candidatus Polarisedimenticolia bacterium]
MDKPKRLNPAPFVALLVIGAITFFHFSQHVRSVDAVGLSGSGFALGIGVFAIITVLRAKKGT